MENDRKVAIGLMGLGVVGSGVATILLEKAESIAQQVGCPVEIKKVLVREPTKLREVPLTSHQVSVDPWEILGDPEIAIVIELIGGEEPAHQYICEALRQGKHVITANKEVMAKHGPQLLELAEANRAAIHYEASVGGGIPLIAPFRQSLLANDITALHAIINGTTNYILTKMGRDHLDLAPALQEAQALGYAETDPTNDIEGIDAAYKLAILASLAFHTRVAPHQVYREGITKLKARDFRYAQEFGYAIKLLAIAKCDTAGVEVRVHPTFISQEHILAKVDGVFNAVEVEGDLTGPIMFYGRGAGSLPTTSAVVADLIELAQAVYQGTSRSIPTRPLRTLPVKPLEEIETRYYVRMSVSDQPGVLAQIAKILGDHKISIASVIQKESDETAQTAEIVLMTHIASEKAMQQALLKMATLSCVAEIGTVVRVEE